MDTIRSGRFFVWVPAAFCAFLSLGKLFLPDGAEPAFYSFLPMCFLWVGIVQLSLWRRLDALDARSSGASNPANGEPAPRALRAPEDRSP